MPDDLLDVLPTILASLEEPSTSRASLLQLAQLVDNISGAAALELGEALRALGAIDTLAALLDADDFVLLRRALMILANVCSDAFDARSDETKAMLCEMRVVERLLPLLESADVAVACSCARRAMTVGLMSIDVTANPYSSS